MKLSKVTHNDPVQRLPLSIHTSVQVELKRYQRHYKAVHGDDISMSQLVEAMLKHFMQADRQFQTAQNIPDPQAPLGGATRG